jgi:acetyl esterase/lipase
MANDLIAHDPRIDPRIKAIFAAIDLPPSPGDVSDRDVLLKEASSEEARAARAMLKSFMDAVDSEEVAPSAGLEITEHRITSKPDGNQINLRLIRPVGIEPAPCVYYIHGGGMAAMSCDDGNYRAWGRIIANQGVAVAMVDFRNSVSPSSVPEVAPFPAGLNDCLSGLEWISSEAESLGIDRERIIVAGESGGGNLTLATGLKAQAGREAGSRQGLVRLVPVHRRFVAARRPAVVDREQRDPPRPAQQPGSDGIRDRGVREPQPVGLALVRHDRGRRRAGPHCHQRQRV